jgi:hypothetical protein
MHDLEVIFREAIAGGLKRKSVKTCSKWTQMYRVGGGELPGPWSFKWHPWSKEMHDCSSPFMAGMKSAQMAYTETLMNKTFFNMDIHNVNCLYVFPNKNPDASDFSASRFDPALELSPHIKMMFSDVKNIGHKRAGAANLWIRGSRSRVGLKSIDPTFVALDEVDEMDQDNIQLALRRTDGQMAPSIAAISTPTVPEFGIHKMYLNSSQERWMFECPNCRKVMQLEFPDCLVVIGDNLLDPRIKESHVICSLCKKMIKHEDKIKSSRETGIWVPTYPDITERRGFYVNQLSSLRKTPDRIAVTAIEAESNPAAEQELWNSIAGLPHVVAGGRVEDHHMDACFKTERRMNDPVPNFKVRTMGVDIGKWLHYEIAGWSIPKMGPDLNAIARCEVIKVGKVEHFHELKQLMQEFQVQFAVLDKQPEERAVYDFCCQFWGRAKRCHYSRGVGTKKMVVSPSDEDHLVSVSRTFWLDTSLGRVRAGNIIFPRDLPMEYRQHMKNVVKKYKKADENTDQDETAIYVKTGADHFAHARNYNEMALPLAAALATNQNIRSFL